MENIDENKKSNSRRFILFAVLSIFICIFLIILYFYNKTFKSFEGSIRTKVDIENNISLSEKNFKIKNSQYYIFAIDYVLHDTDLSTRYQSREIIEGHDNIGVIMDFYLKVTNNDNSTVVFEGIINSKGLEGDGGFYMTRVLKWLYLSKGNYTVYIRPDKVYDYDIFDVYLNVRYPRRG